MRLSTLVIAISVSILTGCAPQAPAPGSQSASSSSAANGMKALQTGHFSVQYPADWTQKSNVTMPEAGYETLGTLLEYPAEKDGTTLSSAAVHLSFGSACPSLENAETTGDAASKTIGGETWTQVSRDGAGAGNRYQGDTYTYEGHGGCYAISTLLHSCNLGPDCGESHSTPFDKAAMDALFDRILSSFSFRT